jgi:hypothetical protein
LVRKYWKKSAVESEEQIRDYTLGKFAVVYVRSAHTIIESGWV